MGFTISGTLGGGNPRIAKATVKNDEVISLGDILTLASNEAALGTTDDAAFIGVALEDVDNSADGETVRVIISPDAIYAYRDGTAHAMGATLDLGSDSASLAASSNADFTVITNNSATEDTLVIITPGEHFLHGGG